MNILFLIRGQNCRFKYISMKRVCVRVLTSIYIGNISKRVYVGVLTRTYIGNISRIAIGAYW